MKTEHKSDSKANGEHKPLETAKLETFIEIEDRLAQALTSEEIQAKSAQLINQIRKALLSKDYITAKVSSLELKQLNRLSNFRIQRLKNEVQSLQGNADSIFLSFNNLANEISHIKKSITNCLDFRSSDLDLELVPVEEFLEKGARGIGFDLAQKDDEHQLRIGQLNFELAQRNAMSDSLREKEDLKNLLTSDIKGKINRLGQIRPLIGTIRDAAKPLLDILNLKKVAEITPESRRRAQLLAKELKLLHLYCGVYNELYPDEPLIYGCEGEILAVEKFERRQRSETPDLDEKMEVEDEEQADEEEVIERKRRKLTPAKEKQDIQSLRERILQCHPIALILSIPCGDVLVNLHFYYLPDIKCITVKSSIKNKIQHSELFLTEHLFDDLLESDSGEECPNSVGTTLLKFVDVNISDHLITIGKPYRFAQLIGNLHEDSTNLNPQFENFKLFVNAARQRVIDRLSLSKTLHLLESATYERAFPAFVKKVESKNLARLTSLKIDFNPTTTSFPQQDQWQSIFAAEVDKTVNLARGFQLQCNVDCGPLQLTVFAFIPYSYPSSTPTILLNPKQPLESKRLASTLKNFEKALNLRVSSKTNEEKTDVFATQFAILIRRLPILFQLEFSAENRHYIGGKLHAMTIEQLLF